MLFLAETDWMTFWTAAGVCVVVAGMFAGWMSSMHRKLSNHGAKLSAHGEKLENIEADLTKRDSEMNELSKSLGELKNTVVGGIIKLETLLIGVKDSQDALFRKADATDQRLNLQGESIARLQPHRRAT